MTFDHRSRIRTSRREMLGRAGRVGAAAVGIAALPTALAGTAGAVANRSAISGVSLTPHPFFPNLARSATPAPELLDELARAYGKTTATPTMDEFLFGWAPSRLFEDALAPRGSGPDLAEAIWVMHLAGYFGGIWLRLKFRDFGNPRFGSPPTEASFDPLAGRLDEATAAVEDTDAGALAYAETGLRAGQQIGLADSYGYNAGYLDQILTGSAPIGVTPPTNVISFTDDGLFDGTYGVGELKFLQRWRAMARPASGGPRTGIDALTEGAGGADDLRAIQAAGAARGRVTWQLPFLSIAGWDQPSYDSLVATSVVFLQTTQITGLAALAAAGRGRSDWARQAGWANGLLAPYGGSYGVGLFDNTYDGVAVDAALPSFV